MVVHCSVGHFWQRFDNIVMNWGSLKPRFCFVDSEREREPTKVYNLGYHKESLDSRLELGENKCAW